MEKIELIEEFLREYGVNWVDRTIIETKETFLLKTEERRQAEETDFYIVKYTTLVVKLKDYDEEFKLNVGVDTTYFHIYDLENKLLKQYFEKEDLTDEWIKFCCKRKGLIYQLAVQKDILSAKEVVNYQAEDEIRIYINDVYKKRNKTFAKYDKLLEDIYKLINEQ